MQALCSYTLADPKVMRNPYPYYEPLQGAFVRKLARIVGAGGPAGPARSEYQHGDSSRLEEPARAVSDMRRLT
jgi:hypothetical protein